MEATKDLSSMPSTGQTPPSSISSLPLPLDTLIAGMLPQSGTRLSIVSSRQAIDAETQADIVVSDHILQHVRDYRSAIQDWFSAVSVGGHLVLAVPHAFLFNRALSAPSSWDLNAVRVYTPKLLAEEIEEALAPNSYRMRHLFDDDIGYDYDSPPTMPPIGGRVIAILQKIAQPAWMPGEQAHLNPPSPDHTFFAARSRIETSGGTPHARILLLKLDHLGDFVMAIPAIGRIRTLFPKAEITLIVGSWNQEMATELDFVDHVVPFDIFPRNSAEEAVDIHGRKGLFEQTVMGHYDLAIDLRTDPDTRFLLASVDANLRAGLGLESEFPFLDIFLPVDFTRRGHESSLEEMIDHHRFQSEPPCSRNDYRIGFDDTRRAERILVWGPYFQLRSGTYIVEPRLEIMALPRKGLLKIELTLNDRVIAQEAITTYTVPKFRFEVERDGTTLEMRIRSDRRHPPLAFNLYGARLLRQGSGDILHQSEYLLLLVELIGTRITRKNLLSEVKKASSA